MTGIVGGPRQYDGPGLGSGPWKCPACLVENTGPIAAGCGSCGSGSAQAYKVGQPPPTALHLPATAQSLSFQAVKADMERGIETMDYILAVRSLAETWCEQHPEAIPVDAFVAGYQLARQQAVAHTMAAPPVTTDLTELAPEGKSRRTIIAALELFKDQILREATDEIANGEWCSIEETEEIISSLKREEGSL